VRSASFVMSRIAATSTRLRSAREPTRAPSGSASTTFPTIFFRDESTPVTMTCRAVNSHAQRGRGEPNIFFTGSRTLLLNESHLIDFSQCCLACQYLGYGALAQRSHSFFVSSTLDL